MSHFVSIKTQIKDVDALRSAAVELGLALEGQGNKSSVARGWASNTRQADYTVRCKGPYDVAADRQADGTYALTTDWWGGHVEKEVGKDFRRLVQLYGVNKAINEARRRSLSVSRVNQPNGEIRLVIGGAL